jgi:ferredoxin-NADP reductase
MQARTERTAAWRVAGETVARRLFLDRQVRFWAGTRWSPDEVHARIVDVVSETHDTKTFRLEPDARWRGHHAGQYVTVAVEVDGVRLRRCYSLSSAPADRLLSITVKRAAGGRVSPWLHDYLHRGDTLRLSAAAGAFVLVDPAPARLLFVTGGSGITPVMSMLRDLAHRGAVGDVALVHHARNRDDVIFRSALEALAARHAGLRLFLNPRFDESRLAVQVPDFASRATWLCGPPGLMERVEKMWAQADATGGLCRERFVAPRIAAVPAVDAPGLQVRFAESGRTHAITSGGTLLEELERAGERPRHGCRIGICHTCKCRKRAGTVRNLVTGAVSAEPDEDIQLCISVACSDVDLSL